MSRAQERRRLQVILVVWTFFACCGSLVINGTADENFEETRQTVVVLQKQCLEWIPPRTETTVAVKGPFVVKQRIPNDEPSSFEQQLETAALALLFAIREGKYAQALRGQTILLALEGAYHFRFPFREGVSLYDGCHILVFDDKFATAGDEFMQTVKSGADRTYEDNRQDIYAFDEDWSDNRWELLICRPRWNVLLIATSRNYLGSILSAMARDPNVNTVSLKLRTDLPEWSHVDLAARFWAIRHYDLGNSTHDITSPLVRTDLSGLHETGGTQDRRAIGMTFSYDPSKPKIARVRYLSTNPDREHVVKSRWFVPSKMTAAIQLIGDNLADIVFSLETPKKAEQFLYLLAAELGHGISL